MYNIRLANKKDIISILEIMREAYDHLDNKTWYYIENTYDVDWVKKHLSKEGFIVIAESKKNMVGFLVVRIPKNSDDNLGRDFVPDIENVAHMETTAVSLTARGNNLLCKMIEKAESLLVPNFTHLMTTVHPDNLASLKSFRNCGYNVISKNTNKYGNKYKRYILLKER